MAKQGLHVAARQGVKTLLDIQDEAGKRRTMKGRLFQLVLESVSDVPGCTAWNAAIQTSGEALAPKRQKLLAQDRAPKSIEHWKHAYRITLPSSKKGGKPAAMEAWNSCAKWPRASRDMDLTSATLKPHAAVALPVRICRLT